MADGDKTVTTTTTSEERTKPAGIIDSLFGNSDEYGQETNPDGSPVKVIEGTEVAVETNGE